MSNEYLATKEGLFKDGKKVPLEFGNKEQIRAVRKYEREAGMLDSEEGFKVEPEYQCKAEGDFSCTCGRKVYYEFDCDGNGDVDPFVGETVNCHACGNEYQFTVDESDEVYVKRYYNLEEEL